MKLTSVTFCLLFSTMALAQGLPTETTYPNWRRSQTDEILCYAISSRTNMPIRPISESECRTRKPIRYRRQLLGAAPLKCYAFAAMNGDTRILFRGEPVDDDLCSPLIPASVKPTQDWMPNINNGDRSPRREEEDVPRNLERNGSQASEA